MSHFVEFELIICNQIGFCLKKQIKCDTFVDVLLIKKHKMQKHFRLNLRYCYTDSLWLTYFIS
jgi:hypothetical protein